MQVTLNGERRTIPDGITVDTLLKQLGLVPEATVVERNETILERSAYRDTTLAEGDTLELVRFVGGG